MNPNLRIVDKQNQYLSKEDWVDQSLPKGGQFEETKVGREADRRKGETP
jgi:hypothetical protein